MTGIKEFDYSINLLRSINWRFDKTVKLRGLVQNKQNWIDENHTQFWTDWYTDVFDLRTANDFGLSVWAFILDVPIFVFSPSSNAPVFGFSTNNQNFGRGNFAGATSTVIPLTTEQLRLALRMRFYQLHTDGSVPHINAFLNHLFGDQGVAYVRDNRDMSIDYIFNFALPSNLAFVLQRYDILPTPQGVRDNIIINP